MNKASIESSYPDNFWGIVSPKGAVKEGEPTARES